ncbi:MAG: UPF0158 family protein [Parachlamydiaceae bacterium]|nr:UPF0158 family protein [Parachlamydiaceae bacterium]
MCAKINKQDAQNPLILRCHRLMDAFAKSDDERDFYIDRMEGFLVFVDLDKGETEIEALENELKNNNDRYCLIPKLSFYETKKIMEGFVNEKVYDIDTKEKLLDIIQSKEARENFLEFIFDHHSEQEKWQQFYQERSRIRIIEWLRLNHFHFVFEEDLDLPRLLIEKLKQNLFQSKVGKDILTARKGLIAKAKTYYSNEALNPRPKRGRPPKQAIKQEIEPQITTDIYTTVPQQVLPFLFTPDMGSSSGFSAFSTKFEADENRRFLLGEEASIQQKLAALRSLSTKWVEPESGAAPKQNNVGFDDFGDEDDDDDDDEFEPKPKKAAKTQAKKPLKKIEKAKVVPVKKVPPKPVVKAKATTPAPKKPAKIEKPKPKRIIPKTASAPKNKTVFKKLKPIKKLKPR